MVKKLKSKDTEIQIGTRHAGQGSVAYNHTMEASNAKMSQKEEDCIKNLSQVTVGDIQISS